MCTLEILRTFGYHSLVTPNQVNKLCPNLNLNCCTMNDQMKMHKTVNSPLIKYYDQLHEMAHTKGLIKVQALWSQIESLDFLNTMGEYQRVDNPPPQDFFEYSNKVYQMFKPHTSKIMNQILKEYQNRESKKIRKKVKATRSQALCSLCNYRNHKFFDLAENKIFYNKKFCSKFLRPIAENLYTKYYKIVRPLMILDEWVYLMSNRRLIEDDIERLKMRRYIKMSATCKSSPDKGCDKICSEFNINKRTDIFDGEKTFFQNYYANFQKFMEIYDTGVTEMFKQNFIKWDRVQVRQLEMESIINSDFGVDLNQPLPTQVKPQQFKTKINIKKIINFIQKPHPKYPIQVETLEDEVDLFKLYRIIETPLDMTNYQAEVTGFGINILLDGKGNNLNLKKSEFLGILSSAKNDVSSLNEEIDNYVLKLRKNWNLVPIINFNLDCHLAFKKIRSVRETEDLLQKITKIKQEFQQKFQSTTVAVPQQPTQVANPQTTPVQNPQTPTTRKLISFTKIIVTSIILLLI